MSFPRRRESTACKIMDSHLRGMTTLGIKLIPVPYLFKYTYTFVLLWATTRVRPYQNLATSRVVKELLYGYSVQISTDGSYCSWLRSPSVLEYICPPRIKTVPSGNREAVWLACRKFKEATAVRELSAGSNSST
jgi:hypothetical protein